MVKFENNASKQFGFLKMLIVISFKYVAIVYLICVDNEYYFIDKILTGLYEIQQGLK